MIDWPLPSDDPMKVRISILGGDKMEAANLAAIDHFKELKRTASQVEEAFVARERAELVFLAYDMGNGVAGSIAESTDELVEELGYESIAVLYGEWARFQAETTRRPMTDKQMTTFIEELKKNIHEVPLHALPSSWLIALMHTLVSQLVSSTQANGAG